MSAPDPSTAHRAVFLSYASQDAAAAKKICDALRATGVEVWFDQNELTGGDAWDQKIRGQVKSCALFMPVVSAATQARREGYFRLEWKLADDRTHLMAKGTPFLVPVCVDDTKDWDALVPDSFMSVQWTRLPGGETPPKFCARVQALLRGDAERSGSAVGARLARPGRRAWTSHAPTRISTPVESPGNHRRGAGGGRGCLFCPPTKTRPGSDGSSARGGAAGKNFNRRPGRGGARGPRLAARSGAQARDRVDRRTRSDVGGLSTRR